MQVEDFDPIAALAQATCPRCMTLGLVTPTAADSASVKPEDVHRPAAIICPSVAARCPACGLVGEWPAMDATEGEDVR